MDSPEAYSQVPMSSSPILTGRRQSPERLTPIPGTSYQGQLSRSSPDFLTTSPLQSSLRTQSTRRRIRFPSRTPSPARFTQSQFSGSPSGSPISSLQETRSYSPPRRQTRSPISSPTAGLGPPVSSSPYTPPTGYQPINRTPPRSPSYGANFFSPLRTSGDPLESSPLDLSPPLMQRRPRRLIPTREIPKRVPARLQEFYNLRGRRSPPPVPQRPPEEYHDYSNVKTPSPRSRGQMPRFRRTVICASPQTNYETGSDYSASDIESPVTQPRGPKRLEVPIDEQNPPPWYVAFAPALSPSPVPFHGRTPRTGRRTISPEPVQIRPPLPQFVSPKPPRPISQYTSPGVSPVSMDYSFERENFSDEYLPPEFRLKEPLTVDLERIFPEDDLSDLSQNERDNQRQLKFYKFEFEAVQGELRTILNRLMPDVAYDKWAPPAILVKYLEGYIEDLRAEKHQLQKELEKYISSGVQPQQTEVKTMDNDRIRKLEYTLREIEELLQAEVEDNKRLNLFNFTLQKEMAELKDENKRLFEMRFRSQKHQFDINHAEMDALKKREEEAQRKILELKGSLDAADDRYYRALCHMETLHEKFSQVVQMKKRIMVSRDDNRKEVVEDVIRDVCNMAERFFGGEREPSQEAAQAAIDKWRELVEAEIEGDARYDYQLAWEQVVYKEEIVRSNARKIEYVKREKEIMEEVKRAKQSAKAKSLELQKTRENIKITEENLHYAAEYCREIYNLWYDYKYKYITSARKAGVEVVGTAEGRWKPINISPRRQQQP